MISAKILLAKISIKHEDRPKASDLQEIPYSNFSSKPSQTWSPTQKEHGIQERPSTGELRKPAMSLTQGIPGQMEAAQCPSCSGSLQPEPACPGTWPRFLSPLGRAGFILSICWWCFSCKPWGPCPRHLPPREVWLWWSWQLQRGSGWMQRQKWPYLLSFQSLIELWLSGLSPARCSRNILTKGPHRSQASWSHSVGSPLPEGYSDNTVLSLRPSLNLRL